MTLNAPFRDPALAASSGRYRLGVDIGGTFTDFVLLDTLTGAVFREKCLTTPDDPVRGILTGIRALRARHGLAGADIAKVLHATTLVTNTVIERKGARTGFVTTEGFRDILELGADQRYDMYDLAIEFPEPLNERALRVGIAERTSADGVRLRRPDEGEVLERTRELLDAGAQSIAVCLLHSYRNPENELAVEQALLAAYPDLDVSISFKIAPEIREYERSLTVVANAYVKPVIRTYLRNLADRLAEEDVHAPVLVMTSNGGVTGTAAAAEFPIRLLESGPAAGVLAAGHFGRTNGAGDLIAFDMGGTTAKACFIDAGEPSFTGTFEAARVRPQFRGSGLPLRIPSVEMIEIGAGGGSIARIDRSGLLKVGPTSAGARPGPVCYGLGGHEPTVTDADLFLGYLDPDRFLGGAMTLAASASAESIARLGREAGLSAEEAAVGIVQVVTQNMATAVRIHAAERGKDYRRYQLFAFGGAGPVHCYELAKALGITRLLVPLGAGTNSAFGLLVSPAAVDLARSYIARLDEIDWGQLGTIYREMEAEAEDILRRSGESEVRFARSAELHYGGQGFELSIPVPTDVLGPETGRELAERFEEAYRAVYHFLPGDLPIEAVTWRLRAIGADPGVRVDPRGGAPAQLPRTRRAYFSEAGGFVDAAVLNRYALTPGEAFDGPALIEENESTLVVGPNGHVRIADDLTIEVVIDASASGRVA